ncbi:C40 family peptidase [Pectobacteriaceae bacterium C52]|nr:C40 family peptidase [Pectobacteriaceae bacterium C52]
MRLFVTFFLLFFSNLFFNLAQAAPHAVAVSLHKLNVGVTDTVDTRKNKPSKNTKKATVPTHDKKERGSKGYSLKTTKTAHSHSKATRNSAAHPKYLTRPSTKYRTKTHETKATEIKHVASKRHIENGEPTHHRTQDRKIKIAARTKSRESKHKKALPLSVMRRKHYQHVKLTAMNKLLKQIGKPYHWGGASPAAGFDCSGLIYYAYKDVVKIPIPRTANEMFHLRDAAPIKKSELERGDLVFFHISNRGAADHVGVYLGNGRFIQSPRTGSDIKISKLSGNYWQEHYVGARRVVTPKTVR